MFRTYEILEKKTLENVKFSKNAKETTFSDSDYQHLAVVTALDEQHGDDETKFDIDNSIGVVSASKIQVRGLMSVSGIESFFIAEIKY